MVLGGEELLWAQLDSLDVCVGASLTLLAAMGAVARRAGRDWAAGRRVAVCTLNGQEASWEEQTACALLSIDLGQATTAMTCSPATTSTSPARQSHARRPNASAAQAPPLLRRPHVPGQAMPAATTHGHCAAASCCCDCCCCCCCSTATTTCHHHSTRPSTATPKQPAPLAHGYMCTCFAPPAATSK